MAGLSPDQLEFIHRCRVARLATVDRHGEAFLVPVCYACDGERFFTPIDEKPKRHDRPLKRVRNILETGRATLLFDHYEDVDWTRLAWLMVRGVAEVIEPDHALHAGAVQLLRQRYRQYHQMRLEHCAIIVLYPDHVSGWGLQAALLP